jgi:hypothetical protein
MTFICKIDLSLIQNMEPVKLNINLLNYSLNPAPPA